MCVLIVSLQSHVCAAEKASHQDVQSCERHSDSPPTTTTTVVPAEPADDKELDQSIELYNKLRGGYRNTDIPLQKNNCYETTASALRK